MVTRGVRIQLVAFVALALVAVSVLSARYVGLFDKVAGGSYVVTADFADSGGIFTGAEVTYRGVTVGKVDRLRLTDGGVLVDLRMHRGSQVPRDTLAVVENRSAVGEQYVDLQPRTRRAARTSAAASRIARDDTRTPTRIDTVLLDVDRLVRSVDQDDLSTTVDELGKTFAGGGTDLQRLIDAGDALTQSATEALPRDDEADPGRQAGAGHPDGLRPRHPLVRRRPGRPVRPAAHQRQRPAHRAGPRRRRQPAGRRAAARRTAPTSARCSPTSSRSARSR